MEDKKFRTFIRVILFASLSVLFMHYRFSFIVNKQESDIKKNYPNRCQTY